MEKAKTMDKGKMLSLSAAALGIALTAGLTSVFAADTQDDVAVAENKTSHVERAQEFEQHQERIDELLEDGDIEALKAELNNRPEKGHGEGFVKKGINQMHRDGEFGEAGEDHGMKGIHEDGMHNGMHAGDEERREALDDAITNDDYSTWSSLMEEQLNEMRDKMLNEDHFNTLVDIQDARDAGDKEAARELHNQLREQMMEQ